MDKEIKEKLIEELNKSLKEAKEEGESDKAERFENLLKSVKPLRDKVSLGGGAITLSL